MARIIAINCKAAGIPFHRCAPTCEAAIMLIRCDDCGGRFQCEGSATPAEIKALLDSVSDNHDCKRRQEQTRGLEALLADLTAPDGSLCV